LPWAGLAQTVSVAAAAALRSVPGVAPRGMAYPCGGGMPGAQEPADADATAGRAVPGPGSTLKHGANMTRPQESCAKQGAGVTVESASNDSKRNSPSIEAGPRRTRPAKVTLGGHSIAVEEPVPGSEALGRSLICN
jgi:hypothetical protein